MAEQVCNRRCVFIFIVLVYLGAYRDFFLPGYSIHNRIFPRKFGKMTKEVYHLNKCFRLSWNITQEFGSLSGQTVNPHMIDNVMIDERQNNRTNSYTDQFLNDKTKARKEKCSLFLTKSDFIGRLGNQIFQYSSLLGMACEYDYVPFITTNSSILQKYFDIPYVADIALKKLTPLKCIGSKYAKHYNCSSYLQNQTEGTFVIPESKYLQSWKYFSKCSSIVKQALKLKQKHIVSARNFLSTITKGWNTTVCIHVRRGDMTFESSRYEGYTVANETYIHKAQHYFEHIYSYVMFVVLSDDMSWCKQNLKRNIIFSPFNNPGDDMALMTLCDHVIVTSGTFGWWGAWLSGGTIVYFKQFIRGNSRLSEGTVLEDYFPPLWIPM